MLFCLLLEILRFSSVVNICLKIIFNFQEFYSLTSNFFLYFDLGFTACQDYFTHFSRVSWKVGRIRKIPEKKHVDTRKQNLACLTCDPS